MFLQYNQAVKFATNNKSISFNPRMIKFVVALLLLAVISWLFINIQTHQYLPIRKIHAQGIFEHVSEKMILSAVSKELNAGYINLNVTNLQRAVETLSWVKSASIRRVWPDSIVVSILEQDAEVIWQRGGLLNGNGEIFQPEKNTYPKKLPIIFGAEGLNVQAMDKYHLFQRLLNQINLQIVYFQFDQRRAIQMKLNNNITLLLGREHYQTRLIRFINIYKPELQAMQHKIQRIDLRYTNGFSITWKRKKTDMMSGIVRGMKNV